jgi:predicted glutamine amidotransferase
MCGLVGCISTYFFGYEIERFQHLALMATMRGKIGGGVVVIPVKQSAPPLIYRDETLSHVVLGNDFCSTVFKKDARHSVIMGHARAPTSGGWDLTDTHPHVHDHVIGMHNGTMKRVRNRTIANDECDSSLLFRHIADEGIDAAVQQSDGAYALTWIDTRAGTINFLRNADRPLYFGHYKDDIGIYYWSSEAEMLHYVLTREQLDEKRPPVIQTLPENQLISMRLSNSAEIRPVHIRQCKKSHLPVIVGGKATSNVPLTKEVVEARRSSFTSVPSSQQPTCLTEDGAPEHWETKVNNWVPAKDVIELLNKGCNACGTSATEEEFHKDNALVWYRPREFICQNCYENEPVAREYAHVELGYGARP